MNIDAIMQAARDAAAEQDALDAQLAPYLERARFWTRMSLPQSARLIADRPRWVTYRLEIAKGRIAKQPLDANGYKSDCGNPQNHMPLNNAVDLCERFPERHHGVGYVFTGDMGVVGFDFDTYKPNTEDNKKIIGYAQQFKTLAMRSLSGKGTHMYALVNDRALLKHLGHRRTKILGECEIYSTSGFFAVTFDMLNETPVSEGNKLLAYIIGSHERLHGKLPDDSLSVTPPVAYRGDVKELLRRAEVIRPGLIERLDTPNPDDWSEAWMIIVGDLIKVGADQNAIWDICKDRPFILLSSDKGNESRSEKAQRLLFGKPSWWNKQVAANSTHHPELKLPQGAALSLKFGTGESK
jgi:hypothetical protein